VERNIRRSVSAEEAFAMLKDVTRHPADAPVLMDLYRRLNKQAPVEELRKQFLEAIAASNEASKVDARPDFGALKPDSVLVGTVAEVETAEEVLIEFATPDGERFVEPFDRRELHDIDSDYKGARVKYFTYQEGVWNTSRFEAYPS
jgi:hypothetical protein